MAIHFRSVWCLFISLITLHVVHHNTMAGAYCLFLYLSKKLLPWFQIQLFLVLRNWRQWPALPLHARFTIQRLGCDGIKLFSLMLPITFNSMRTKLSTIKQIRLSEVSLDSQGCSIVAWLRMEWTLHCSSLFRKEVIQLFLGFACSLGDCASWFQRDRCCNPLLGYCSVS